MSLILIYLVSALSTFTATSGDPSICRLLADFTPAAPPCAGLMRRGLVSWRASCLNRCVTDRSSSSTTPMPTITASVCRSDYATAFPPTLPNDAATPSSRAMLFPLSGWTNAGATPNVSNTPTPAAVWNGFLGVWL